VSLTSSPEGVSTYSADVLKPRSLVAYCAIYSGCKMSGGLAFEADLRALSYLDCCRYRAKCGGHNLKLALHGFYCFHFLEYG
jgi:hypothetical protein